MAISREAFQTVILENRIALLAAGSAILLAPVFHLANADYRGWLALGPGGLPYNIGGWLIQCLLRPIARERLSTTCYDDPKIIAQAEPSGSSAFLALEEIPERRGTRPKFGPWVVPHRQLTDQAFPKVKKHIQAFISSLAESDPSHLSIATSGLERRGQALFLKGTTESHPIARQLKGEISHMHEEDGSLHLTLAPHDAKTVIERGWGERQGLSGVLLPRSYLMVYAPRSGENEEEEIKVVESIIRASVRFMLEQQKV